uniref:Uncharacterized protein n=1 Tax=Globisporangium ultimum (strain ATCC 200006 / CBS 805.95 / DAOM BR144) TaxID=431595 RepID=K3WXX1_GLOUD
FHVSWAQCVGAIVIYGLLLTDVIRTGLGVADVSSLYWVLEPDGLFALSGPWITAIGTFAAPHKTAPSSPQTDNQTLKLWPYKFDTTSIGMRAFARFLNLTAWPQCVFQRQVQCVGVDFNSLSKDTVFHMLDALVDGQHAPVVGATTATTLRVQSTWYDRVHDFILPPLFASKLTHTTQALYFNSSARIGSGLCSHAVSIRPYHCASFLGNVKHLSTMDGALNDRLVSQVIVDRVDAMQTQFPATQLDFVVIETKSDAFMGSLSFQGRRTVSIVLITRLRSCTSIDNCATAFIDDYRFDDVLGSSNVAQWYRIVSTLRVIGQSYVWVRLFALVLAFHQSTCADPLLTKHSRFARWKLTAKALLVIPSHVIVYSSVLPIACYTIAHAIDSSMTYEMLNQKFTTADGVLNVNLLEFFYWSSIQMRNIWLLALALHALSYLLLVAVDWIVGNR